MKTLHRFDDPVVNEEIGSIDYTVNEKRKKMLRVILKGKKGIHYTQLVKKTVIDKDDSDIDEVYIITNRLTEAARDIVISDDSLSYISPNILNPFSITELKYVIDERIIDLEKLIDEKNPEFSDFKSQIDVIKKNAKFHATMNWHDLLLEDLNTLISVQDEQKTEVN
jgi:hypothetical protein